MARRKEDENMMNNMENMEGRGMRSESTGSQNSSNLHSVSHFSRRDLKGVVESSHMDSSKNGTGESSQYSIGNSKLTSNIDSIYGFYKKKGVDGDDLDDDDPQTVQENSRNTSNFENTANMGNYVPANQMLDLRLLNAEINASVTSNQIKKNQRQDQRMSGIMGSGKNSRVKATGEQAAPIEIFSFKQSANKKNYNTLNQKTLWNADPLNKKYGLEMSSNENEASMNQNYGRRGVGAHNLVVKDQDSNEENQRVSDELDNQRAQINPSPGMIFSNRPTAGVAGIGKMSEYAQTGIYIDPNQITRKIKPKKKQCGRDIKYAIKDLEAASFMDMDDFMSGGLAKAQKPQPNEEPVDDQVTEKEVEDAMTMEDQFKQAQKRPKRDQNYGMDNFKQNVMNRVNLTNLENQDFQKMVNIYYKDMKYPIYDFSHVCPPPPMHLNKNSARTKHTKMEVPLCTAYREHLYGLKQNEETKSQTNSQQSSDRPSQFRVVGIERRYGMASLIVQNEQKHPMSGAITFSKVLLSPVFDILKIWTGDKIQLSHDYKVFPTAIRKCQGMQVEIQLEDLDEPHVTQIIHSKQIINMTTSTEMDTHTNTETASVSHLADGTSARNHDETMSHRTAQDESMSNRGDIEASSCAGDLNDLETNMVA